MNVSECRERLTELLQAQNVLIGQANDYLVTVRQAIAGNSLETLQQSIADPGLAIEDIEGLEQQRYQLVERSGFGKDRDGFEKCIAWCDDGQGQVAELYQQLIHGLVQMQRSLQLNSLLINKGQDRVRRSIGILTGLGTSAGCKTYSSKGKAIDPVGSRDIAVA